MTWPLPSRGVRWAAIASLVANLVIIATGGLVRLTGSGLGCSSWPKCTPDAFTTTPEQGIHGLIEFGNRTLTGALLIIAAWAVLAVYELRRTSDGSRTLGVPLTFTRHPARRDLVALVWIQVAGILLQAVVGGMVVIFHLTWNLVGFHYLLSIVLVALMTVFVVRAHSTAAPRERAVGVPTAIITHIMTLVLTVTVVLGVFATGSGPHSGDLSQVQRTGIDAELIYHVHAVAAYLLFALTIAIVVLARSGPALLRRWSAALLLVELVQIAVGVTQARLALPVSLVLVHMVLAGALTSAGVGTVLALKQPRSAMTAESADR